MNEMIIVYHGTSYGDIEKFEIRESDRGLDFGKGVYFTTNRKQAEEWSLNRSDKGYVYKCELDCSDLKVLRYAEKSEDFIYSIYLCRIKLEDVAKENIENFEDADIVFGLMVDGKIKEIVNKLEQFNEGDIDYSELFNAIDVFEDEKNQICVKSQYALKKVKIVERITITKQ